MCARKRFSTNLEKKSRDSALKAPRRLLGVRNHCTEDCYSSCEFDALRELVMPEDDEAHLWLHTQLEKVNEDVEEEYRKQREAICH